MPGCLVPISKKPHFHVTRAADGRAALEAFEVSPPALILLDIMLPNMDGFELLGLIREKSSCPVIMLTARDGINVGWPDWTAAPTIICPSPLSRKK